MHRATAASIASTMMRLTRSVMNSVTDVRRSKDSSLVPSEPEIGQFFSLISPSTLNTSIALRDKFSSKAFSTEVIFGATRTQIVALTRCRAGVRAAAILQETNHEQHYRQDQRHGQ